MIRVEGGWRERRYFLVDLCSYGTFVRGVGFFGTRVYCLIEEENTHVQGKKTDIVFFGGSVFLIV